MSESKVTTRAQMIEYILKTIGILYKTSTYVVKELGIKRVDIIEGMDRYELIKWRMNQAH